MELYKEVLFKILEKEEINQMLINLWANAKSAVELECYEALRKIKAIIEDDNLSDFDCIEKIVCIFEEIGSNGGNRHDFG